jgi:PP-loop superfamily ATP-utilizing enzyme
VEKADMLRMLEEADEITAAIKEQGRFTYVAMDLGGYKRGSMNAAPMTGNVISSEIIPIDLIPLHAA